MRTRALVTTPEQMHSRRPIPSLVAAHQRALITSCEASGCLQVAQRSSAALSMSTREGEAEFLLSPYRPVSSPDGDRLGPPIRCQRKYPSVVSPYARSDPTRAERTSWCPGMRSSKAAYRYVRRGPSGPGLRAMGLGCIGLSPAYGDPVDTASTSCTSTESIRRCRSKTLLGARARPHHWLLADREVRD